MAASATLALKAGVWFRRGRLFIVSPDSLAQRARCQAETPLIDLFKFAEPALISTIFSDLPSLRLALDLEGRSAGRTIHIRASAIERLHERSL
jgi:hypothetical protein